jgi:hypothetical protein
MIFKRLKTLSTVAALVVSAWTLRPESVSAQSTVNPTKALFNASADHNKINPDGSAAVQSYQIEFYLAGATAPFQTTSLGKPAPDSTNTITVNLSSMLIGWPIPGTNYVADVASVGPGGISRSTPSNTFTFTSTCSFGLSSASQNVVAAGGSGSTTVTTGSSCAWSVVSNTNWITVSGGSSRTGSGAVNFTIAANTSTNPRTGTLSIAGQTFTVSQAGACNFTVSPTSLDVPGNGGPGSATVTTTSTCGWSVKSNASWITVSGGSSRTGSSTMDFTVAPNTGTGSRTGTLTIADKTLNVTEASPVPDAPSNVRIVTSP